ncbi:MAG: PQQ-binding-like beta-propeller repeat protein [Caldilineaceae bacterium]
MHDQHNSRVRNPYAQRMGRRSAVLLQSVLLALMMALSALIGFIWFGGEGLLFPPTPTPTATVGPRTAPTRDFRATRVAEDAATQVAYSTLAERLGLSPLAKPTQPNNAPNATAAISATLTVAALTALPAITPTGLSAATPTGTGTVAVILPVVINNGGGGNNEGGNPPPTPTPVQISELPTEAPTEPPTEIPTEVPTPIPTDTPTLPPPTPTLTPSPTLYFVDSLKAFVKATPSVAPRTGPSNLNITTTPIASGVELSLRGRDETGEWVYVCCPDNFSYWLRLAYVDIRDNVLPTTAPTEAPTNDVRLLLLQPPPPTTVPVFTPTPIPSDQYPLYRHDRYNSGQVPSLPGPPLQPGWSNPDQAGNVLISPAVVNATHVIVASADNSLYAFNRTTGRREWGYVVAQPVHMAPLIQDTWIYFVDDTGRVVGLEDVNGVQFRWQQTLNEPPVSNLLFADNRLYLITRSASNQYLLHSLDRGNGALLPTFGNSDALSPFAAIGHQLIYVGNPQLRALDIYNFEAVWTNPAIQNITAQPVYILNGPNALAELYVADNTGHVYAVDANTGRILWNTNIGRIVTGIAVSATKVFITGEGYWGNLARDTGILSSVNATGNIIGGPIIDNDRLLLVSTTGTVQLFQADSGQLLDSQQMPNNWQVSGAPAVGGLYIYIPTDNTIVYTYQGQP